MKHYLLIALLLTLALGRAAAQGPGRLPGTPDSVAALLRQHALPDTVRVYALAQLSSLRRQTDLGEARQLGEQGLALARRQHYLSGELKCLISLAVTASNARQYARAEQLGQQALHLSDNAPARLLPLRASALRTLAEISTGQGHHFARAGRYYRQALAITQALRPAKPHLLNDIVVSLASLYVNRFQFGETTDSVRRLATRYARQGLQGAQALHDSYNVGAGLTSLSIIARTTHQYDSAVYFLQQAIGVYQRSDDLGSAAFAWQEVAFVRQQQGRHAEAVQAALRTVELAKQVQDLRTEGGGYEILCDAYAGQSKYRQAYEAATKLLTLSDSLNTLANNQQLNNLQVRFDTERKETRIQQLTQQQQQQHQRLWTLAAVLALVLAALAAVAVLALRLRRSRALLATQYAELTQTRAAQDRLYALVAHDLRSPVVAFTGLADLLHRYVQRQDTTRLAGLGGRIRQAAQHLSELLDNLLNWALSQRGELVPTPRPLRVTELLAEITALYQNTADAADIALSCEAPTDLLVLADPDMTRTILRNLTGNALQATPAGGRVTLHATRSPAGSGQLQITDTGEGLDPETLAQLAAPATHLHVAQQGQGAGLGLLLSRNFAEAQGGQLTLANVPNDAGTVATLTLPLAPAGSLVAAANPTTRQPA
ncbi:MAG: ATP-binding protein [Janthinobacterium lividum]